MDFQITVVALSLLASLGVLVGSLIYTYRKVMNAKKSVD